MPKNDQHGGAGWTVQYPGGGHEHRYPDGHIRHHISGNADSNLINILLGGTIIVGAGIGIVVIMADDVTGVGMADNAMIPVLCGTFMEGVQLIGGQ